MIAKWLREPRRLSSIVAADHGEEERSLAAGISKPSPQGGSALK
jgi:hypothetical protein